MAHLTDEDRAAVRAHLGDQVALDDVTIWRAIRRAHGNEHRLWRMIPDDQKIAAAASAEALTAAAIGVVEYASDKITRIHGQREASDRTARNLQRLRRTAATD